MSETEKAFKKRFPADKLAKEIALIAFSDMRDYVQVDEAGAAKPLGFDQLKAGRSKVIKKIREKRRILQTKGGDDEIVLEDTFEFELWDKEEALRLGAEYSGYKPVARIKAEIDHGLKNLSDDELEALIAKLSTGKI